MTRWPVCALGLLLLAPHGGAAQDVMTPELLWQLRRVSNPEVSPDGTQFLFGVTEYDLAENRGNTDLLIASVERGEPHKLTDFPGREFSAQWRPDAARIGFLSDRTGSVQLWEIDPDGTDLRQLSDIPGGIDNFSYAPNGSHVSFTREVEITPTPSGMYRDLPLATARIIDGLMYRHWKQWRDDVYRHVFIAEYGDGVLGAPVDLMSGEPYDTPLQPFGGAEQIAWNIDGTMVAYTAKKLPGTQAAVSTNADIYLYDRATGTTSNLTEGMPGYDVEPIFSPDGRYVAWLSMERDGYESDRNRLFLHDLAEDTSRELTVGFDQDAHSPRWSPDGQTIYFTSEVQGTIQLYSVNLDGDSVRQITDGWHNYTGFGIGSTDGGRTLIAGRQSMSSPTEIYRVDAATGDAVQLTFFNAPTLDRIRLGRVEQRVVKATDGADILTWIIYPPGFDPGRTYPALLYAPGGPQSTVSQFFSYRWNFQAMAANGYVVVAPNRRGVPGFGQAFKEQISGDWGGQAMQDLLVAIDTVAAEPFVDGNRLGAVGASFGGYTVYWLAGHHEGRFKTFIAHAGVFNLESMYGTTEEMFFVNFDLKGPYWASPTPSSYERFSPHAFVGRWDTPMLVIHGEKDFRVPVSEGIQAFTALQLKGIESRFLYFPNEGHWISSPQNGVLWHRVFNDWLARYLHPPGA